MKKIILITVITICLLTISFTIFAMKDESEMVSSLPDKYFEWQGRAVTQLDFSDRDDIFTDNSENYLHAKALESYTKAALWLLAYSDSYSTK